MYCVVWHNVERQEGGYFGGYIIWAVTLGCLMIIFSETSSRLVIVISAVCDAGGNTNASFSLGIFCVRQFDKICVFFEFAFFVFYFQNFFDFTEIFLTLKDSSFFLELKNC